MKKIKNMIILFTILIIIIIGIIIFIKTQKNDSEVVIEDREGMGINEFPEDITKEINITELLQIDSCIEKYLNVLNRKSTLYYGNNENGEYTKLVEDKYINKKALDFLSKDYIEENNIREDNIVDYVSFSDVNQEYTIINAKKVKNTNPNQFIIYGLLSENYELKNYEYYIITMDSVNSTFSIKPINYEVNEIDEIEVKETQVEINSNNKIPVVAINAENICKFYFNMLKNNLMINSEKAYEILDDEYSKGRFLDEKNFIDYINKNKLEISELDLRKYQINNDEDNTEYLLVDQYNNVYTVDAEKVLNFKIKLDTYTLLTDKFKENYDSATKQEKVMMNVDKWVQMLNNRDYTNAYNVLDETFRNNNFGSQEEFENFMKEKYPLHYKAKYGEFTETNNTYTQEIILNDITQNTDENSIQTTIIMQLKDDYNFVMSFEIDN